MIISSSVFETLDEELLPSLQDQDRPHLDYGNIIGNPHYVHTNTNTKYKYKLYLYLSLCRGHTKGEGTCAAQNYKNNAKNNSSSKRKTILKLYFR